VKNGYLYGPCELVAPPSRLEGLGLGPGLHRARVRGDGPSALPYLAPRPHRIHARPPPSARLAAPSAIRACWQIYEPGALTPDGGKFVGTLHESKVWDGEWVDYDQASPGGNPCTCPDLMTSSVPALQAGESAHNAAVGKGGHGIYNGPVRSGQREGFGICRYPNGDVYRGEYRNGVRCGSGVCRYGDAEGNPGNIMFSGQWEGDTTVGDTDRNLSWAKAGEWVGAREPHINGSIQQ
jgi:hypothetical protein